MTYNSCENLKVACPFLVNFMAFSCEFYGLWILWFKTSSCHKETSTWAGQVCWSLTIKSGLHSLGTCATTVTSVFQTCHLKPLVLVIAAVWITYLIKAPMRFVIKWRIQGSKCDEPLHWKFTPSRDIIMGMRVGNHLLQASISAPSTDLKRIQNPNSLFRDLGADKLFSTHYQVINWSGIRVQVWLCLTWNPIVSPCRPTANHSWRL